MGKKIDCHLHTPLCGHASGSPVDYVRRAAERDLDIITFTCHIPMDDDRFGGPAIRMNRNQLPEYFALVEEAAQFGKTLGTKVLCGIEAEIFPDPLAMAKMDEIIKSYPFDFILGSLHHQLPSYRDWLTENRITGDYEVTETYFNHLIDGVRSRRYHSMAHPDVIRIYGTVSDFHPRDHEQTILRFLEAMVEEDVCMEVNTSGLVKGVYEVHPDPIILDWAAEMGVKLTIGSDAHKISSVAQRFRKVLPMLKEKGFKQLHYYVGGKRKSSNIRL